MNSEFYSTKDNVGAADVISAISNLHKVYDGAIDQILDGVKSRNEVLSDFIDKISAKADTE